MPLVTVEVRDLPAGTLRAYDDGSMQITRNNGTYDFIREEEAEAIADVVNNLE